MPQAKKPEQEILQRIVGEQLSSVEFVMDYVQLRFNGPTLTAVTHPVVEVHGRVYSWGECGFRDALCERIAKRVTSALVKPGDLLRIEFADSSAVKISLRDEDYVGAEAVIFDSGPAHFWVL